jgi:hypothetical protein
LQQVFAAKESQLKELQAAFAAEQAARATEAECVSWLQSKVDALTQENYEVRQTLGHCPVVHRSLAPGQGAWLLVTAGRRWGASVQERCKVQEFVRCQLPLLQLRCGLMHCLK